MTYSISCVLLIPAEHQEEINTLADSLGYGPNNLSVLLSKSDGSIWYGCHTWCAQEFLNRLAKTLYAEEVTESLIVSTIPYGDPADNWNETLIAHELSVVETE